MSETPPIEKSMLRESRIPPRMSSRRTVIRSSPPPTRAARTNTRSSIGIVIGTRFPPPRSRGCSPPPDAPSVDHVAGALARFEDTTRGFAGLDAPATAAASRSRRGRPARCRAGCDRAAPRRGGPSPSRAHLLQHWGPRRERERDLAPGAEAEGPAFDLDEPWVLDVGQVLLQLRDLGLERGIRGAQLGGAIRRGRRLADLAQEADRKQARDEDARGRDDTPP